MKKKSVGFTLLELLIGLVVASILAVVGIPSYTALIQKNKQSSQLKYFVSSLHFARSEAIKRSKTIVSCTSNDGNTCSNAINWDSGWIVFIDDDRDNVHDNGEMLLKVQNEFDDGYTLIGSTNVKSLLRYRPNGISMEDGTFTLCDPRGADEAKAVIINITGRPTVKDTNADGSGLSC